MGNADSIDAVAGQVAASGLVPPGSDGVAMVSGGADSAVLAALLVRICGPQSVSAIHLNYGLRPDSDAGEDAARAVCAKLRIDLHIERPELGEGNLQARARDARYEAAERLRAKLGADWIATGHTRTDLAETVLYRLAVSPGSRGLTGLRPQAGRRLRPLLGLSRDRTRAIARDAALPFVDDPSNLDPRFARNRIRSELLPALAEINPEAERNIAETHAELAQESDLLRELAADAIRAAGCEGGAPIRHEELATMHPALRRVVLATLGERVAAGRPVRISRRRAEEILRLAADPEGGVVELGRGVEAVAEAGTVRFAIAGTEPPAPEPVRLTIPGRARYGDWEIRAELTEQPPQPTGPELAALDPARLGGEVEIRAWREGDRIRPLGLGGSKSLQDLFTDRGVPRSLRRRLPVLVAGERIAWVAGVAVSDEFRAGSGDPGAGPARGSARWAVITARAAGEGDRDI